MHGEGIYTYSSGKENLYIGNYKNGKKHGYGKIKENGKIIYEGEFNEGVPHGKGIRFDKNGIKIDVEMDKGKRINKTKSEKKGDSKSVSPKKIGLSKIKIS